MPSPPPSPAPPGGVPPRGDVLELAPLRGLRYADEGDLVTAPPFDIALALAPPYDMLNAAALAALIEAEPRNAVRLTVPPAANGASGSMSALSGPDRYRTAAATLHRWIATGVLVRDPEPVLYVYEQTGLDGERQRGLIGALRLPRTPGGVVRAHEDVADTPVADRAALMAATRANLEPIFLLYQGGSGTDRGAAGQAVDTAADSARGLLVEAVTADGTTHRLWAIADPEVHAAIAADLAGRSALIADGHHRYAAYQRLRGELGGADPWAGYGLAMLVDSDTSPPHLRAIHRVLPGLDARMAARAAAKTADVEALPGGPDDPGSVEGAVERLHAAAHGPALLLGGAGRWWLLHGFGPDRLAAAMPGHSPRWRTLPTAVLDGVLLPAWGITEDSAVLVHDSPSEAAARTGPRDSVVVVPPLTVDEVYAITAGGELTPRKSTSFGPKPRTGLVLRADDDT
ncbi:DUF1015 family protein [Murinocardiopsis flavida]|uniref:DUF1015 family protein n=1 Tax=Murinocardiopsis flavida TaxID=645275 RepID=UPI001FEA116E|nr:DUF1015 domain-containing protein [Murinocardiopsis flavida]